jgi:predicted transcriptional regulator
LYFAKTFYNEELRTSQIAAIQQQYDKAIVENSLAEEKNNTLTMFAVILILIIVVLLALVYYQRRVSQYKSAISGYVKQINADRQRIMELESTSKDSEKEVSILKADIEHIQQISAGKLGRGKDLYEQIAQKEKPRSFTKSKEQDFVDYYAYTFHQQYYRLVQPYQALTLRQTSFLILQEMGLDDKAIGELFDVSASAVRNYRHRLK